MPRQVLGSVQPSYLAWIPFYQRMCFSDVFVYLDDVQYSKNSFHNRNRIKTNQGPQTLTVPVLYKGNSGKHIKDMPINNETDWQKKHWRTIEQGYAKAPYFADLAPRLEKKFFGEKWTYLGDLNVGLIECFRDYLGIATPCYRSSELSVDGEANEKLVNLCKKLQAAAFIVKPGTEDYHPGEFFREHGIEFSLFSPPAEPYRQLHGDFVPGLSILDFAMNMGPNSFKRIGLL